MGYSNHSLGATYLTPRGNPYDGQKVTMRIRQDTIGGRKLILSTGFRKSSVPLTFATTPNAVNLLTFQYDEFADKWSLVKLVTMA
jgi:hypothetical protein